jgi:hypothetical protein
MAEIHIVAQHKNIHELCNVLFAVITTHFLRVGKLGPDVGFFVIYTAFLILLQNEKRKKKEKKKTNKKQQKQRKEHKLAKHKHPQGLFSAHGRQTAR